MFAVSLVSSFLSNNATTMVFIAIAAGLIKALNIEEDHNVAKALKLSTGYGVAAGGFATPIGAPATNFLTISLILSLTKYTVRIGDWLLFGVPFAIISFIVMIIFFKFAYNLKLEDLGRASDYAKEQLEKLGPLSRGEKNALAVVIIAVVLWMIPSACSLIYGKGADITKMADTLLNSSAIAVLGGILCFIVPIDWKEKKFTVNWKDASKSIEWGVIVIVTGGLVLSAGLTNKDIGILKWIVDGLGSALQGTPPVVVLLVLNLIGIFLTQVISNVPCTSLMLPLAAATASAVGLNPVAACIMASVAANHSYALPFQLPPWLWFMEPVELR